MKARAAALVSQLTPRRAFPAISSAGGRAMMLLAVGVVANGCADLVVSLAYAPNTSESAVSQAQAKAVTVFQLTDNRGDEGSHDPYKVGGIYGEVGQRVRKITVQVPFQETLAVALAQELKNQGLNDVVVEQRFFAPGDALKTPLALAGEVHNFSTERRHYRMVPQAHVSGVVHLYDKTGSLLFEKTFLRGSPLR